MNLTARYGGIARSRVVLIKAPILSSLSVQTKIRAGGQGRVTVRLSGRAPAGGLTLKVKSNRPSVLPFPGDVTIAAGNSSAVLIVDAAMVSKDVPVNVIARHNGVQLIRPTIVRNYAAASPTPTATLTPTESATATETATATIAPIATPSNTPHPSATQTELETATTTAAATATPHRPTATSTATPTATYPVPTGTPVPMSTHTAIATSTPGPWMPVRATFYYPWFPESWTQQGIYPYTNYHPSAGYYDGADPDVVAAHIAAMQYGNIELGISSWWGIDHRTNTRFSTLLAAASGTGFKWTVYYEREGQDDPAADTIREDLNYLKSAYASDPAYYTIDGKFVVFVYADTLDGCGMVDRWKEANTVGAYVVLKVFPGYKSCANQPDGWHQYGPAVAASNQPPYSYSISPGFWKVGEQPSLERDPGRWRQNIRDMIASGAQFQLVISFNEWGEGTGVESTTEWASGSGYGDYLDALHANGAEPTPIATPTETASPTAMATETATPVPTITETLEPTATPTETPISEPTVTPTITLVPEPAQLSFTLADNPITVGQQSSAEMCWVNPSPGLGTIDLSVMASRGAGTLTGSPNLKIVGVATGEFLTVTLTMASPCITIPLAGESAGGPAYLVVQFDTQAGLQSSPGVYVTDPVALFPTAPIRWRVMAGGPRPS